MSVFALRSGRTLSTLFAAAVIALLGAAAQRPAASVTLPPGGLPTPRQAFGYYCTDGPVHALDTARAVTTFGQTTVYSAGYLTQSLIPGTTTEVHAWHLEKREANNASFWAPD